MKSFLPAFLIACLCGLASIAHSQSNPIPNPGFEEWNDSLPVAWTIYEGSFQSEVAHSGLYAVGGEVFDSLDPFYSGGAEADFHLNFNPASFEGYYKLVSVQNDYLMNVVWIFRKGSIIGTG
ncbi:MAG TPA: hypothetical protein VFX22_03010, partial [Candidatus Kapabacteria bacterium]|nr:hypothetical protein [Candidatus Kapabacteria bacterium]